MSNKGDFTNKYHLAMELCGDLNNYQKISDSNLWETLVPLEFFKKTHIITEVIPSKIEHIPDHKRWVPVLTVLFVREGTKVDLVLSKKKKIESCRLETATVKQQRALDGLKETYEILIANSFYDDSFFYETGKIVNEILKENNGIYAYTTALNAKYH